MAHQTGLHATSCGSSGGWNVRHCEANDINKWEALQQQQQQPNEQPRKNSISSHRMDLQSRWRPSAEEWETSVGLAPASPSWVKHISNWSGGSQGDPANEKELPVPWPGSTLPVLPNWCENNFEFLVKKRSDSSRAQWNHCILFVELKVTSLAVQRVRNRDNMATERRNAVYHRVAPTTQDFPRSVSSSFKLYRPL